MRRKITFLKCFLLLVSCYVTFRVAMVTRSIILNRAWIDSRKFAMERYFKKRSLQVVKNGMTCSLPDINPFDKNIVSFMKLQSRTCHLKKYGRVKGNVFTVDATNGVREVYLQYIRRGAAKYEHIITKKKNLIDDEITLSNYISLKRTGDVFQHILSEDFIRVTIQFRMSSHVEHHAIVAETKELVRKFPTRGQLSKMPYSVVLYMIDSLSHANFKRQLIQTDELMSNDDDTIIFNGQTVVGDGTTAALSALLTGIPEEILPETRRSYTNKTCDQYEMIFKDFEKHGYITQFSEDDTFAAAFNYRLNGFINKPAFWYLRPFFLSLNNQTDYRKNRGVCGTTQTIDNLKYFISNFKNKKTFSFVSNALISHNNVNQVQTIDEQVKQLYLHLKYHPIKPDTIFVLFGDHGVRYGPIRNTLQGKLEERLPFLSITLPKSFKEKYKEAYKNLQDNSNILTTPFDIYETLKHLLTYPTLPKPKSFGQSLFTRIDGRNRTCASAGVEEHWCPCFSEKTINPSSQEGIDVVKELVDAMNNLIAIHKDARTKCAQISLHRIDSISKRIVNNKVNHFVESKRDEKCDSCGVVSSSSDSKNNFIFYEVSFTVLPSKGTFEASGRFQDRKLLDKPVYSRTNMYGNQPSCISSKYPHLRPYCYCK